MLRSVLSISAVYTLWGKVVGGPKAITTLMRDYIRPTAGMRIMEIGCGPGVIFGYLPRGVEYTGFDISPEYIESAQKRFPEARFVCQRVSRFALEKEQDFDMVLALGIVHHLDDEEASTLFKTSRDALKPGGKLITMDGVWVNGQSPIAHWILSKDRGEHIRSEAGYEAIARRAFDNIGATVRHDMLRIPYSHLLLECVR